MLGAFRQRLPAADLAFLELVSCLAATRSRSRSTRPCRHWPSWILKNSASTGRALTHELVVSPVILPSTVSSSGSVPRRHKWKISRR